MLTRLSDYVISRIEREGVKHVFMVSGGGGMYLIDSLGRNQNMKYICNHHEQASVMSAEGYQRITDGLGVALVTTGPAGTNALTGVLCAWNDSIPLLVLSGQSNSKYLIGNTGLRQRGVHEADITKIVSTVTKYAVTITDENMIHFHLEKALYLAKSGRPGPVWIDIPIDIQAKMIDPDKTKSFKPIGEFKEEITISNSDIDEIISLLTVASRPIILAGHGIRLGHAINEFTQFIERHQIPVVTTKNAFDLIEDSHPLLAGRIGINGQRSGNFAIQNSDLVIALGSRLAFPSVGYATEYFARYAKIVAVDIDRQQLKHSNVRIDYPLCSDVKKFLNSLEDNINKSNLGDYTLWVNRCKTWRSSYPSVISEWKDDSGYVNPYYFFEILSEEMSSAEVLVTDQGASFYCSTVAFKVKNGQRAYTNGGFSPMGYGLPAAIGSCFALEQQNVICVHGEGGLEMNIQELQTVVHYNLPIKLFVFNNNGYLSIKHTQMAYFEGKFIGCDPGSGVSCPDVIKIAEAYGIKSSRIVDHKDIREKIRTAIGIDGPVIIEVVLDPMQPFLPKVTSERKQDGKMVSKPLEDMYPYLSRDEFNAQMIVQPVRE